MNDKPHLDEEALAELKDVMEDEFDILIQTYINDSSERIEALHQALLGGDLDEFAKTAHSFKGSSINIGAPRLGQVCFEAEKLGKAGALEQAPAVLEQIYTEFREVQQRLENFG